VQDVADAIRHQVYHSLDENLYQTGVQVCWRPFNLPGATTTDAGLSRRPPTTWRSCRRSIRGSCWRCAGSMSWATTTTGILPQEPRKMDKKVGRAAASILRLRHASIMRR